MPNVSNVVYDYTPYHAVFQIYTYASYTLSILSLPIYTYTLYYIAFRARKHIKNYNRILLLKLFWNFLYEQISSGLALIWFSPIMVNCPRGWISYIGISPTIWQSIALCSAHTLAVSISHLYFYQLKAALWQTNFQPYLERVGHLLFLMLYAAGFLIFTLQIVMPFKGSLDISKDRLAYSMLASGLPDYFWFAQCYVTPLPTLHPEVLPYYTASATMATINAFFIYTIPILTIAVIYFKFRRLNTGNARMHKKLLLSLFAQTLVYFIFYLIPTHISQTSLTSLWFNPPVIQLTIFCTQIHGTLIVVVLFGMTKPFRDDLLADLHLQSRPTKNLEVFSHTVKLRTSTAM